MFDFNPWQALLVFSSWALIWITFRFQASLTNREKYVTYALGYCLAACHLWSFTLFGKLIDYGPPYFSETYHYHEMGHYVLPTKYYPELSNRYCYKAQAVALSELHQEGKIIPNIREVRDLDAPFYFQGMGEAVYFNAEVKQRFTPERWAAFKQDVFQFASLTPNGGQWDYILADMGYNPPPTHALLGHLVTPWIGELTRAKLSALPLFDWVPMLIMGVVITRVFGFWPAFAFLTILGNTVLAGYGWALGSFFRHTWLWTLGLGVCCLHKKYWLRAGMFMGASACFRVFPAIFIVGALIPLIGPLGLNWLKTGILPDKAQLKPAALLIAGTGIVTISLVLLSLLCFPLANWVDFLSRMSLHGKTFFVMHMGYEKIATAFWAQGNQDFSGAVGLLHMQTWNIQLNELYNKYYIFHKCLSLGGVIYMALALSRARPAIAALIFGEVVLFFFTLPANYYYIYFAILAAVSTYELLQKTVGSLPRFIALGLFTFTCHFAGIISNDPILQNAYMNICLALLVLVYLISYRSSVTAVVRQLRAPPQL
jgi:hypothetical protein